MRKTDGHFDVDVRLREMDADGIAAEVIFHGVANGGPIPFVAGLGTMPGTPNKEDADRMHAGLHMYNQWLADFVSASPDRLIGSVQVPIWDLDATVREITWAREAGLRVLNFPAPRTGTLPEYDLAVWEPLWEACDALEMSLVTHSGTGDWAMATGPQQFALNFVEAGGWFSRRGIGRMIFGGVFERHPSLKLIITEAPGAWWGYLRSELDSSWTLCREALAEQVPHPPRDYMAKNVFHANSFMSHSEAEEAVAGGYAHNVIWGRDYPHPEGTWVRPEHDGESTLTMESLRFCLGGLPAPEVARMAGLNGIDAYGLDGDKLAEVAARDRCPESRGPHASPRRHPRRRRVGGVSHRGCVGLSNVDVERQGRGS